MTKRILVVEDDILIAILTEQTLQEAGYEVRICESLADAEAAELYDGYVFDINLDGRSSVELILKLDRMRLPIVIVSGEVGLDSYDQRLLHIPAFAKPSMPEEVVWKLNELLLVHP